ncbi:ORF99-like protein [Bufonid herpesvirus 1]|uniref:ORF99-like protein n=1 Tax=Bufonid herpesvirus 1 TaxID=2282206 RepID=UPI000EB614E9|nr:ORF99-like protein [Bufonid herpesvirus 1]AXF48532.1 ORF99-like protein [Bufonid herpesvirus 1]
MAEKSYTLKSVKLSNKGIVVKLVGEKDIKRLDIALETCTQPNLYKQLKVTPKNNSDVCVSLDSFTTTISLLTGECVSDSTPACQSYVSGIYEWCAKRKLNAPIMDMQRSGQDHIPTFTVKWTICFGNNEKVCAEACETSLKKAKQEAAGCLLVKLAKYGDTI